MPPVPDGELTPQAEMMRGLAGSILGGAMAIALLEEGWSVQGDVGDPIALVRDGRRIEVFNALLETAVSDTAASDWDRICREAGIADLDLGAVAAREQAATDQSD